MTSVSACAMHSSFTAHVANPSSLTPSSPQARDQAAATAGATSPDESLGVTAAPHLPSAAAAAAQKLPWIQELLTMLRPGVPPHLTGVYECTPLDHGRGTVTSLLVC